MHVYKAYRIGLLTMKAIEYEVYICTYAYMYMYIYVQVDTYVHVDTYIKCVMYGYICIQTCIYRIVLQIKKSINYDVKWVKSYVYVQVGI
jgi:hypothetical protein